MRKPGGYGYGESSLCLASRARARLHALGYTRKWDETTGQSRNVTNCLCLRLASRVCTLGAGSGVDVDIDDYRVCPVAHVHDPRKVPIRADTRAGECTCTCTKGYRALTGGVRLAYRVRGRRSSRGSGL